MVGRAAPLAERRTGMNDPAAWVLDTFRRVFARAPREDELSLYLH
jgi:hypothetical protein